MQNIPFLEGIDLLRQDTVPQSGGGNVFYIPTAKSDIWKSLPNGPYQLVIEVMER